MQHPPDTALPRPEADTLAGFAAHWATIQGNAPALGPLSWADLDAAIRAHKVSGPVVAVPGDELATTLPHALAALGSAAALLAPAQPTKRARPGELILPLHLAGGEELVRYAETGLAAMGRALARRYHLAPNDRIWLDGALTEPASWLILAAALYAGCPVSLDPEGATIAWQLNGGTPCTSAALRLIHLRAGRDTLAELQRSRPDLTVVNGLALAQAGGLPLCSDPRDPAATVAATMGRPLHGMEVMIVDPRTGMDMLLYETGEVWLRGPGVMAGYANGIAPFEPARFLRTGILGFLDSEGRLVLSRTEEEALLGAA
ncbi:AMP-binding protein [Sinisalibacter aestuarii]|uniref:AMP-dependent synthetase/ligase domain-containing protein n=1 Tax=Sinisalibacter aestuarii TaxID=2949426 RepID=A0ABQ5LXA1_9RHOB|nr:AMP-binding protein [Sinisalibacter aestuarii]GKY89595.1 hypothetical protein STA1M1_34640 [Sinisalibacter aestuarii]